MKVKIFTEGGNNVGLGHISRCTSLYDDISRRGISVELIVYGDVLSVGFLDEINIINDNWLERDYLLHNISPDDYVIIDSYKAEKEIYEIITKLSRRALFIDDIGRLNYPNEIIVNPALDASHIDYSQSPDSTLLSGPDYVILRTPFIEVERENLNEEVRRVLITMGGTDIRELTPLIVNNICKKRLDLIFDIVTGSNELENPQNKYKESHNINIHANINATEMMNLMINADLVITAAGQTVYELLATQTPFIPIQIIENQENNIRSLLKYNPEQIVLKYDNDNLVDNLLKALEIANEFEHREKQNLKYKGLIDGYGSRRIINELLKDG